MKNFTRITVALTLLLAIGWLVALLPVTADGGDFSLDFVAAAPYTYDHTTGGGAYNDRTIGKDLDVVESLEGGDFTCDDTVTYLIAITVGGDGSDDPQTIEVSTSFLANTTGQPGVAHAEILGVSVNYGLDTGITDDGGSTIPYIAQELDPPGSTVFGAPPDDADNLLLTFHVDDLETGERVIVRIDTRLACDPGSSPTGNLQADLVSATVIDPAVNDPIVGTGAQTIPFRGLANIGGVDPTPTPTSTPTNTATPTNTLLPTSTLAPTFTSTPIHTPTPTPTATENAPTDLPEDAEPARWRLFVPIASAQ